MVIKEPYTKYQNSEGVIENLRCLKNRKRPYFAIINFPVIL
jgi:hypothetical protein